ncbi:hypothetical protein GJ744_007845 [Endocarpon pusillum]|uniref:Rho-GAP domain-containing protein n=1 Tax=Endocarpon pusillum TaxID=364733 RepID=A0A8H7ASX7_9EURO|nr:hypothetical protein GJ744_007845 [Endocarpon pusillum]
MDPLSVVAAIAGILGAAAQVSTSLSTLITKSRKAPKDVQKVKDEVDAIRSVLHQLQAFLLGSARTNRARASLILVDQVVVTLSACVSIFSELDVIVGALVSDEKLGLMDRLRWATKASAIDECLKNLQIKKSSLNLMLTILTCQSSYVAEDSVKHLEGLVENMLTGHERLAQRLASFETTVAPSIDIQTQRDDARLSTTSSIRENQFGFVFEEALKKSWVYQRAARNIDGSSSLFSSAGRTASWSILTGLSLSDISNIAVLSLPIYAEDISNREMYQFGEVDIDTLKRDHSLKTVVEQKGGVVGLSRLNKIASTRLRRNPSVRPAIEDELGLNAVFGVPLLYSIEASCVATLGVRKNRKQFISGHVPTVVATCCAYIREEGLDSKDIFFKSGSARRIQELHNLFSSISSTGGFGPHMTWKKYKIDDAASLLLRYLKLLPEPIIPYNCYRKFTAIYEELVSSMDANDGHDRAQLDAKAKSRLLATVNLALEQTPEVNRHVFLYLLDFLQACVGHSSLNLMTPDRLIAVFQPSLLSLEPDKLSIQEHQIEHQIAHQVMVFMISPGAEAPVFANKGTQGFYI